MNIAEKVDSLLYNLKTKCPYGIKDHAIYREIATENISPEIFEKLIFSGFRRMGNILYKMGCTTCSSCIPIRLKPKEVKYNRSQRRIQALNNDLKIIVNTPAITDEKFSVYKGFLNKRYPDHPKVTEDDYADFFIKTCADTFEVAYMKEKKLIGLATVDISKNLLNGVYFFFNIEFEKRALGIYNIIFLNEFCKKNSIKYFSTGYLIKELSSMNYKANFYPHELLINDIWEKQEK